MCVNSHTHTMLICNSFWQGRGTHNITFVLNWKSPLPGVSVPEEGDDSQSKGQKFTCRSGHSLWTKSKISFWLMFTEIVGLLLPPPTHCGSFSIKSLILKWPLLRHKRALGLSCAADLCDAPFNVGILIRCVRLISELWLGYHANILFKTF